MARSPLAAATERPPVRLWLVPAASVVAGSLLSIGCYVASVPLMPPLGLIMLIAWRLLRPEAWGAWVALPLGLIDDLIGGAPLGSAMAIWTIVMLGFDLVDHRLLWRDFASDWGLAMVALVFATSAAWSVALFTGGAGPYWTVVGQMLLSALAFPAVARLCSALDRWRLGNRGDSGRVA
ncbi:rod shape-determining protein MreD [Sphingomonas sp. AP4-R1]|uniref:rod shape-determining protein MreD n=1 Tax=Sphingomonas sp. AP4-R1 TaxID=2735134 RepID=UPI00149390DE|nr:rod shape-determining protein MreD [Sphingomonas sp. AP4-R1]QJU58853.1 rod shape-determining protein MreD [Sphingomonas sp. AP4-R1]